MSHTVEVMMVGSPVKVGHHVNDARITGILLRDKNYIKYEVSWWDSGERKVDFFEQCEVERVEKTAVTKIGF